MYRKLEEETKPVAGPFETSAGECQCPCVEPTADSEKPAPAAKQAVVYTPVYWDING